MPIAVSDMKMTAKCLIMTPVWSVFFLLISGVWLVYSFLIYLHKDPQYPPVLHIVLPLQQCSHNVVSPSASWRFPIIDGGNVCLAIMGNCVILTSSWRLPMIDGGSVLLFPTVVGRTVFGSPDIAAHFWILTKFCQFINRYFLAHMYNI